MAQRLKNIVHFVGLTPNVPTQLPHGLRDSLGHPLVPDLIAPSIEGATVTADDEDIFVTVNATAIDVYCEAWHTLERSFGKLGEGTFDKLTPQPFVLGGGGGAGGQFEPGRTVFVAKSWPAGADPAIFFTTVAAALAQAVTLVPTQASQVLVRIFPGTYAENVTAPPWAILEGENQNSTVITSVAFTPTGAIAEALNLVGIRTVLNINTTGKTGGSSTVNATNCAIDGLTENARGAVGGNRDLLYLGLCAFGAGAFVLSNTLAEFVACRMRGVTFNGACIHSIVGGEVVAAAGGTQWFVNGTSTGIAAGSTFNGAWNFAAGTSGTFVGCTSTSPVNVAAGASVDVRAANLVVAGAGSANRTTQTFSFGPTIVGANPVLFSAVPTQNYPNGAYNVSLTLKAAGDISNVFVDTKAGTGFTINDPVGGNTFDVTVIHS